MLTRLIIKNFALIEQLDIEFHGGFSVITGETGAGKSIILGALNLLLGARASSQQIKHGTNNCVIEAHFTLSAQTVSPQLFDDFDLDYDEEDTTIRRELTAAGKSRAFINDTPVSLDQLREISRHLIDIHSQHQNLLLERNDYQLSVLDTLGKTNDLLEQYKTQWQTLQEVKATLTEKQLAHSASLKEQDYLSFQLQQLDTVNLTTGEDEMLKAEIELLENAAEIQSSLSQTLTLIESDEQGVLTQLSMAARRLSSLPSAFDDLKDRIASAIIEIKDIATEANHKLEATDIDPARLQTTTDRLNLLYELERKHNVNSSDELIRIADAIRAKLTGINSNEEEIASLQKQAESCEQSLLQTGSLLSEARQRIAAENETQIATQLQELGMPNARFKIEVMPTDTPTAKGLDRVVFLFAANKGGSLQPITDVASGGEIARIMLVIKQLCAAHSQSPTIIFDEIDTGVSGMVADRMRLSLAAMSKEIQVICITHLPQIAAGGDQHYKVYKEDFENTTRTMIKCLSHTERVDEIAKIISGANLTEAAIAHAKQLLS